jgi:hypothetical protein
MNETLDPFFKAICVPSDSRLTHAWNLFKIDTHYALELKLTPEPVYILNGVSTKLRPHNAELIAFCYYDNDWLCSGPFSRCQPLSSSTSNLRSLVVIDIENSVCAHSTQVAISLRTIIASLLDISFRARTERMEDALSTFHIPNHSKQNRVNSNRDYILDGCTGPFLPGEDPSSCEYCN